MALVWKSKPALDEAEVALIFRALAHPIRLRIVKLLLEGDGGACHEIVERLPIAQSTVSQHLKVLRNAGIVSDSPDGSRRRYQFQDGAMDKLRRFLKDFEDKSPIYD
jgi:ArsR family transcriptional regulator, arsenate/arsenite/antimonite-responsive transcriptional repressor